jgi:hypothetical protein
VHRTPRLAEDAEQLLAEGARFLEASSSALAAALLEGDHQVLIAAAEHSLTCNARATRFFSAAVRLDLAEVA